MQRVVLLSECTLYINGILNEILTFDDSAEFDTHVVNFLKSKFDNPNAMNMVHFPHIQIVGLRKNLNRKKTIAMNMNQDAHNDFHHYNEADVIFCPVQFNLQFCLFFQKSTQISRIF